MLADRMSFFDSSGIRKVFDLAAKLPNPINLSIGQPDFDVPEPVRRAACDAINARKNGYSVTQGAPVLRDKLQAVVDAEFRHADRQLFVTSGTSGGLVLAMLALVNPGDEVIVFDPYFVMYESLVRLAGGELKVIDTYPNFGIDMDQVRSAITPRTKVVLFNSPANPTGATPQEAEVRALAELCAERGIALVSDEIYRMFCYGPFVSPAKFNDRTIVIDGFSKSYGMTGWRIGYAHGPSEVIQAMTKLQQYTFVCAPHPLQFAGAAALEVDMRPHIEAYRVKRDRIVAGLEQAGYEVAVPGGAFYVFPKAPWGTGSEFVTAAIEQHQLLIIPGKIFSRRDTHFRISYAASDETIARGIEALAKLARR